MLACCQVIVSISDCISIGYLFCTILCQCLTIPTCRLQDSLLRVVFVSFQSRSCSLMSIHCYGCVSSLKEQTCSLSWRFQNEFGWLFIYVHAQGVQHRERTVQKCMSELKSRSLRNCTASLKVPVSTVHRASIIHKSK